jgi:hypothetical protein
VLFRSNLLVALLTIALVAIAFVILFGLVGCPIALVGLEHEAASGAACHVEFLVNRYQTVVAAAIALLAAYYAGRPVWRQLRLLRVQAASELLPRLEQEASELSSDEILVVAAKRIADNLGGAIGTVQSSPFAGAQVGKAIGFLMPVRQGIDGLRSSGAIENFSLRITLHSSEQKNRKSLVDALNEIAGMCEDLMRIANSKAIGVVGYQGTPLEAQYDEVAAPFADAVRLGVPVILDRLNLEISSAVDAITKMKRDVQLRTELALRATKDFAG